jgi:hypothetical protein
MSKISEAVAMLVVWGLLQLLCKLDLYINAVGSKAGSRAQPVAQNASCKLCRSAEIATV